MINVGPQLATSGTSNTSFTPSVTTDWDIDTVNLSSYVGQNIIVKFEVTNRYGNNLYIDDINISNNTLAANFTANNTAPCIGSTVTLSDNSTGVPSSWSWSFSPATVVYVGGTSVTSQNPQVQFNAAGSYTVTLIATNASGSNTMNKPGYIMVYAKPTAQITSSNVSCYGGSNGTANVTTSGGTPAYTYSWSPLTSSSSSVTNLTTGSYTCTITDAHACTITKTTIVSQPTSALTAASSITAVSCYGGSNGAASVTVSGGTSAYLHALSLDQLYQ